MDVEAVARELYGLRPSEFVAARDAYAAQARKAKDTVAAKAIAALRRPALAAWAANQLARKRPDEARQFLTLGQTLRDAHQRLDRVQLREAGRQQHRLITTLARTAAALARESGQPVSDTMLHEIEQTLHAVLARPDVAELWAKGLLTKVPETTVDFTAVAPREIPGRPSPGEPPAPQRRATRAEGRRREAEQARAAAREADALLQRREQELATAQDAQTAAEGKAQEAADQIRRLEHELKEARRARSGTETDTANAAKTVEAARRALGDARRAAGRARRAAERLEQQRGR